MSRVKKPQYRSIRKEVARLRKENLADPKKSYAPCQNKMRPGLVFHGQKAPKWPRYKKGKNV